MAAAEERRRTTNAEIIASSATPILSAPITTTPHHNFSPRITRFVNRFSSPSQHRPPAGARGFTSFQVTEPILSQDLYSLFRQAQSIPLTEPEAAPLTSQQPLTLPRSINTPHVTSGIHQPTFFSTSDGSNQTGFNWAAYGAVPRHYQSHSTSFGYVPPSSSVGTSVLISSFAAGYVLASIQIFGNPSSSSATGFYGAGYDSATTQGTWQHHVSAAHGFQQHPSSFSKTAFSSSFNMAPIQASSSTAAYLLGFAQGSQQYPMAKSQTGYQPYQLNPSFDPFAAAAAHAAQRTTSTASITPISMSFNIHPSHATPYSGYIPPSYMSSPNPSAAPIYSPSDMIRWGSITGRSLNITVEPFDGNPLSFSIFISSFKALIHDELPNDALRLDAHTIAVSLQDLSQYNFAIGRLYEEYGLDFVVAEAHIDRLLMLPDIKPNDPQSLKSFSNALHAAVSALVNYGHSGDINSTGTLKLLLQKLPNGLRTKWATKVFDMQPQISNIANLDDWTRKLVKSQSIAASIGITQPSSSRQA